MTIFKLLVHDLSICFLLQVTAVQTLKQCVRKQPSVPCVATTPRSTPPHKNFFWMLRPSAWKAVTSCQQWERLCLHPRGLWCPRPKPWHLSFSLCWLTHWVMPWRPCRRFFLMWSRASRRTAVCRIVLPVRTYKPIIPCYMLIGVYSKWSILIFCLLICCRLCS